MASPSPRPAVCCTNAKKRLPVNYLIIESLQKFHHYYSDDFRVECPTGSGHYLSLNGIASELSRRLIRICLRDENGRRPVYGGQEVFQSDPDWRDYLQFHEYFHGDNGAGLGGEPSNRLDSARGEVDSTKRWTGVMNRTLAAASS